MAFIIRKIHLGLIFNLEMRAIRAIAGAIYDIDTAVVNRSDKGTRKTRTIRVGQESGIFNIYIISAVSAVPFQSILFVISDYKCGVTDVQFIVRTEINGMSVSRIRTVHRQTDIFKAQRCTWARTNRHPVPFCSIRSGTDSIHYHIAIFESKIFSPESDTVLFKSNSRIFIQLCCALNHNALRKI